MLACEPRMGGCLLTPLGPLSPAGVVIGALAHGGVDVDEAGVVVRLLEQRQRRGGECVELRQRRLRLELLPVAGGDDAGERLARGVAGTRGSFGCTLGDRRSPTRIGSHGLGEVDLEVYVEPER